MGSDEQNTIQHNATLVTDIFRKKAKFHRHQACLPIEEKIKILVELQKIALTIRPKQGIEDQRMVWQLI